MLFLSARVRVSPSLFGINSFVHIPYFHTVCTSSLASKLLQDDSVCYWLTAHFKSFLLLNPTLSVRHPDTIHFLRLCPQLFQTNTNSVSQFTIYQQSSPSLKAQTPPLCNYTVLQHKTSTSPKALQAAEQGWGLAAIPHFHAWRDKAASQGAVSCKGRLCLPRYLLIPCRY